MFFLKKSLHKEIASFEYKHGFIGNITEDFLTDEVLGIAKSEASDILSIYPVIPSGLLNVGNTCFMNAALQIMFNIKSFWDRIVDYEEAGQPETIIGLLYKLLKNECTDKTGEILFPLRKMVFAKFPLKGEGQEQDASEFLQFLLDHLSWVPLRTEEVGIAKSEFIEPNTLNKPEVKGMISICIDEKISSFQQLLDHHFAPEPQEEPRENNPDFQEWSKQCQIIGDPEHLIVHLRRFKAGAQNKAHIEKITSEIEFSPNVIKVPCKINGQVKEVEYAITSYINHIGETPTSGHYIAYVKSAKDKEWYCLNDSVPSKSQPSLKSSEAYIVVLEKIPHHVSEKDTSLPLDCI